MVLVNAFGLNGKGIEAVQIFRRVPINMTDERMYICVLNACSHSGLSEQAEEIFMNISQKDKTERIYTTMVSQSSQSLLFTFNYP